MFLVNMVKQILRLPIGYTTVIAHVWFFITVDEHVTFKVSPRGKGFQALFTGRKYFFFVLHLKTVMEVYFYFILFFCYPTKQS